MVEKSMVQNTPILNVKHFIQALREENIDFSTLNEHDAIHLIKKLKHKVEYESKVDLYH